MKIWLAAIAGVLALTPQAKSEILPPPPLYAFPASWVAKEQIWVDKYWPGAACRGKVPVPLVGGGKGYRFIECFDELANPPQIIWFRINSGGHVVLEYRLRR